jgi:cytochrome P450
MSDQPPLPTGLQLTALDPVFREDPHPVLDRLRSEDPVHRDKQLERVFVTRFDDVKTVLSDRSLSTDPRKSPPGSYHRRAVIGPGPIEGFELSMLHLDDPDHKRIRGLVSKAFNQRAVDALRPRIRDIASGLLDALAGQSEVELVSRFAAPLPIIVIAEMLGVGAADLDQFRRWSDARAHIFNPARTPEQTSELASAQAGLIDYFLGAADQRRRARGSDLISALVSAEEEGKRLTSREIALTCNLLLVAGNLTTTDLIGNVILALLRHPDQLARLRADQRLIAEAVEETLRYDPPVVQTNRVAVCPVKLDRATIGAGESISASLLAAGHDPARHAQPERFDIDRADKANLAFGGGAHYCIGAPLARAEAEIALSVLIGRYPKLQLNPKRPVKRKAVPIFNGPRAVWVRLD